MRNLQEMTREHLRGTRAELQDKGLRSGYEDRLIDQIEAELDRRVRWEAEQDMQQLDTAVDPDGLDEFGSHLWNAVENGAMMQGACPCGVEGCKGLDWLLDGSEAY
jgi:hypothetical protein